MLISLPSFVVTVALFLSESETQSLCLLFLLLFSASLVCYLALLSETESDFNDSSNSRSSHRTQLMSSFSQNGKVLTVASERLLNGSFP